MATNWGAYAKTSALIDSQVVSGSTSDTFKLAIGQAWTLNPVDYLHSYIDTTPTDERVAANTYAAASYGIGDSFYSFYSYPTDTHPLITGSGGDAIMKIVIGLVSNIEKTLYNASNVSVRIIGNDDKILSNEQWRTYIMGGEYNDINYGGIFPGPGAAFACHAFKYNAPYTEKERSVMNSTPTEAAPYYIDVDANYSKYDTLYENSILDVHETYLPNFYCLNSAYYNYKLSMDGDDTTLLEMWSDSALDLLRTDLVRGYVAPDSIEAGLSAHLTDYRIASLSGNIEAATIGRLFDTEGDTLDTYLRNYSLNLANSNMDDLANKQKNIIFTNPRHAGNYNSATTYDWFHSAPADDPGGIVSASLFPMGISFEFPADHGHGIYRPGTSGRQFVGMLQETGMDAVFMKDVYMTFTGVSSAIPLGERSFYKETIDNHVVFTDEAARTTTYLSYVRGAAFGDSGIVSDTSVIEHSNASLKSMNIYDWWNKVYLNNEKPDSTNCTFIGPPSFSKNMAMDAEGSYRFENTLGAIKLAAMIRKLTDDNISEYDPDRLDSYYSEVVLYRIEKIGGSPTGDDRSVPTIQNFWLLNTADLDIVKFYDTQVHYNKEYTYKLYSYTMVLGVKYQYEDVVISKTLGEYVEHDDNSRDICIQIYNGQTMEPSTAKVVLPEDDPNQFEDPVTTFSTIEDLNDVFDLEMETHANIATAGILISKNAYVADIGIDFEPSIQLYEAHISTYTGRVLDNPPTKIQTYPITYANLEKAISFVVEYNELSDDDRPIIITPTDEEYMTNYIQSHSLPDETDFRYDSISPVDRVEVFRLEKAPKAFTDFSNALRISKSVQSGFSSVLCNDLVEFDTIYYYLIRSVNAKGIPSYPSEIYKVEFIKHGETIFPDIDVYEIPTSSEVVEMSQQKVKDFKRLMRIVPNINQKELDNGAVDSYDSAHDAIEDYRIGQNVEQSIWYNARGDNKFKIRLTSKQTGRAIDLNLKFVLNENPKPRTS